MNGDQEKYVDKINKLLRKAESTTPEEAEALTAKAQELMAEYAITMAMLADREDKPAEEIVEQTMVFTGTYQKALKKIAFAVLESNDCRGFFRNNDWQNPPRQDVVMIGFESDIAQVELLVTSLQVQCMAALQTWWKSYRHECDYMTAGERWRERREFIYGFAQGIGAKLQRARRQGQQAAAAAEAERSGETEEEATASVALVVRERADRVRDWYDEKHGSTVRTVRDRRQTGTLAGAAAGIEAGTSANTDVSGSGIGIGGRHALEAGS